MITVNGSEQEITITLNTGVLQTLLETTANDLLGVFKANRQAPEQPDDKVREDILRELYGIKKELMGSKQQSQSLESESMSEMQRNEPGPSTSSPSSNSAGDVIDLTQDSEQEDSKSERSPKVGQKRLHEESHLSSPPAKRVCSSTRRNSKMSTYFDITAGSSSANSFQNADDAASKEISESVVCTSQQHTVMDLSQILSLNSTSKTTPSGNMSADVAFRNFLAKWNESIPSTSESSRLASPSGESSFSNESSVRFKGSCSKAGSSKSQQKSNLDLEPANVPDRRSTTECVQQTETVNSKCEESSNGPQPTFNTINSEKSAAGSPHKTGTIILLSEKVSTNEVSTKQNIIDSQGSATNMGTKKRDKQSHLDVHDQKQSQAGASRGLSLSVSPTKGKGIGGKGSSRSTKRPSKKGPHSTGQESSSESADRKRGSRCPKSKRHLCPVCSKPDCGKCKNCL